MTPGTGALTIVLAGALVGCGGEPETVGGEIRTVINQQASIDGEPVGGGDPIPAGALVVTDDSGVAVFVVAGDPATCELRPASAVVVLPVEGLLMRLMRGTAVCDRSGTSSSATFAAPGSLIEVGDSTVVIEAAEGGSTVGNVRGEVAVAPAETGVTAVPPQAYVRLDDNEQTQVDEGQAPEPPASYRPSPLDVEAVTRMQGEPGGTTVPEHTTTTTLAEHTTTTILTTTSERTATTATSTSGSA